MYVSEKTFLSCETCVLSNSFLLNNKICLKYLKYVFSLNNSRCSDFVDRIYPVSDLGQHEVLCYLSYEVPYLGPEGAKSGRPTQAVGHTKQRLQI